MAGLLVVAQECSDALRQLATDCTVPFWEIPPEEIATLDRHNRDAAAGSRLWGLYRAWFILMSTPNVGLAITHKILHHKIPRLAPLLDGKTEPILRSHIDPNSNRAVWAQIHHELASQRTAFEDLEAFFSREARTRQTVPLFRLRLHDILLWLGAFPRKRKLAEGLGAAILDDQIPSVG